MNDNPTSDKQRSFEFIKTACIKAAQQGYTNAAFSGLCSEGAFEAAISAIQMLELNEVIEAKNDNI